MKTPGPVRRRRGNDGIASDRDSVLPVRRTLVDHICPFEPYQRKELRIFNGPKAGRRMPSVFTDEEILEIRRMRDWHGMSVAAIMKVTGRPEGTIHGICDYRSRAHLDPGPRPPPDHSTLRASKPNSEASDKHALLISESTASSAH